MRPTYFKQNVFLL